MKPNMHQRALLQFLSCLNFQCTRFSKHCVCVRACVCVSWITACTLSVQKELQQTLPTQSIQSGSDNSERYHTYTRWLQGVCLCVGGVIYVAHLTFISSFLSLLCNTAFICFLSEWRPTDVSAGHIAVSVGAYFYFEFSYLKYHIVSASAV